jgi:hypothetical protein
MTPVGPLRFRRTPQAVRRRIEVAGATAWEAIVATHAEEALRFASLMADTLAFGPAVERYIDEMDIRDPMASAVRSRALTAARSGAAERLETDEAGDEGESRGLELRRLRPDRVVRGIARKVRENEATEQIVRLAIARAEEAVLRTHIQNAVGFGRMLRENQSFDDAAEDYIDLMHLTGGRAQAVYQRAMARLADLYLPDGDAERGQDHDEDDEGTDEHLGV